MEVRMSGLLNTAILWDIENVTPPAGSGYIQSIIETIEEGGKISYAMAFGNWNRPGIKNIAGDLAANSFELIHVPKSRKDSSDMSMVAHGVELIFQYPHVERYVLITGDADFRPLLLSLRKYGKQTLIICDAKNASEDLLKMADDYRDYREIIDDDEEAESRSDDGETETPENSLAARRRLACELLEEAVRSMLKEKNRDSVALGAVKIRMKLMNSSFDERKLGYRMWKFFVNDAVEHTAVRYAPESDNTAVTIDAAREERMPEAFVALLACLPPDGSWGRFDEVSKKLDHKQFGYGKFKRFITDAEKRGIVSTKRQGFTWYLRRAEGFPSLRGK